MVTVMFDLQDGREEDSDSISSKDDDDLTNNTSEESSYSGNGDCSSTLDDHDDEELDDTFYYGNSLLTERKLNIPNVDLYESYVFVTKVEIELIPPIGKITSFHWNNQNKQFKWKET